MDLRQQFEHYEETGSLNYESGLGTYGGGFLGFAILVGTAAFIGSMAVSAGKDAYGWAKNKVQGKIKELKDESKSE
jgi:hypothetical protein